MQIFFHVAVLPCMLAKGGKPFFVAGGGGMPSRHTFFPTLCITFLFFYTDLSNTYWTQISTFFHPHCITFPPLTPLYPIPPSMYHTNNLPHIPHPHPSPLPVHHLRLLEPPTRPHHQITSPFYLPHPIHPSNSIFSEIILPDALLENFLNYYFRELLFHYQDSFRSIYT